MVAAVQTVESAAQGLRVLNVFKPLAARKSLFSVFYVMIDHVRRMGGGSFVDICEVYSVSHKLMQLKLHGLTHMLYVRVCLYIL